MSKHTDKDIFEDQLAALTKGEARISRILHKLLEMPEMKKDSSAKLRCELGELTTIAEELDKCIAATDMPPAEVALFSAMGALFITGLGLRKDIFQAMGMLAETTKNDADVHKVLETYNRFITRLLAMSMSSVTDIEQDKEWLTGVRNRGLVGRRKWEEFLAASKGDVAGAVMDMTADMLMQSFAKTHTRQPGKSCSMCTEKDTCEAAKTGKPTECGPKDQPPGWDTAIDESDNQRLKQ